MSSTALTSELEAVNTILAATDEAPVASLALAGLYPLEAAKACLNEASRVVQAEGWTFNTETDFPLARDVAGRIALPGNLLRVDVNPEYEAAARPVQRGAKLYDAKGHTDVFTVDLKATVVVLLTWDELPEPARYYVMVRAARIAQGRSSSPDGATRFTEEDEQRARLLLSQHEADTGDFNMLDASDVAAAFVGRGI